MKTLFITLSLLFAAVAGTVYAANEKDPQVSEVRKVEAFSSVKVTSVATVYFTQSNSYSLKIEGRVCNHYYYRSERRLPDYRFQE